MVRALGRRYVEADQALNSDSLWLRPAEAPTSPTMRRLLPGLSQVRHALDRAMSYLAALGYATRDVGATCSDDIEGTKGSERLTVEVNGTTSTEDEVTLTSGEVADYRATGAAAMLILVTGITPGRGQTLAATGGTLRAIRPRSIDDSNLAPVSYRYTVPPSAP